MVFQTNGIHSVSAIQNAQPWRSFRIPIVDRLLLGCKFLIQAHQDTSHIDTKCKEARRVENMDLSILNHKQFASLRHNAPKFQMAKAMLDDKLRLGFQTVPFICPQLPKALDP